jgi:hypothetical protein
MLAYDFLGGSYCNSTTENYGWFIDNLAVTDSFEPVEVEYVGFPSASNFVFFARSPGDYWLQVQPKNLNRFFPYGPELVIRLKSGQAAPLRVSLGGSRREAGRGKLEIPVFAENQRPAELVLEAADVLGSVFANSGIAPEDLGGGHYCFSYAWDGI